MELALEMLREARLPTVVEAGELAYKI